MNTKKTFLLIVLVLLAPPVFGSALGATDPGPGWDVVETYEYFLNPAAIAKSVAMAPPDVRIFRRDPATGLDTPVENASIIWGTNVTGGFTVDGGAETRETDAYPGCVSGIRLDTWGVGSVPDFMSVVDIDEGTALNTGWFNPSTGQFFPNGDYATTDPTHPSFGDFAILVNGSWDNRLIGNTYGDGNLYLPEFSYEGYVDYLESITIVPIPEPATLSVFLFGLGALISHRRQVRHKDGA